MTLVKTHAGPISLDLEPEGLVICSPYDPLFLADFKIAIPASARRWDGGRKVWIVEPAQSQKVQKLIEAHYNVPCAMPEGWNVTAPPAHVTEVIQLAYLGGCREREGGLVSASGYTLGNQNPKAPDLVFPESILKAWFEGTGATQTARKPAPPASLYTVLCVAQDADGAALKTAYRRMARQTHPDVNREPDAAEAFRRVQAAYEVLADPLKRRKYDAGLALEDRARQQNPHTARDRSLTSLRQSLPFRAPLRCGLLLVQGEKKLGRLIVSGILSWEDLTRNDRVLVSSWPQDAECWREDWVQP